MGAVQNPVLGAVFWRVLGVVQNPSWVPLWGPAWGTLRRPMSGPVLGAIMWTVLRLVLGPFKIPLRHLVLRPIVGAVLNPLWTPLKGPGTHVTLGETVLLRGNCYFTLHRLHHASRTLVPMLYHLLRSWAPRPVVHRGSVVGLVGVGRRTGGVLWRRVAGPAAVFSGQSHLDGLLLELVQVDPAGDAQALVAVLLPGVGRGATAVDPEVVVEERRHGRQVLERAEGLERDDGPEGKGLGEL